MSYPIEIVPLGKTPVEGIESVCEKLNDIQQEFNYTVAPLRWREEGALFVRTEYKASEVFGRLKQYQIDAKGHRPYLIGFVNRPLSSDKYSNLFGSRESENGVAVVTLNDHERYASLHAYIAYYLVRYAVSFVAPEVKAHDDQTRRWCVFDKKIDKNNLRVSLIEGRFCDDCMRQLETRFTPEILAAIEAIAKLVKDLELNRKEPAEQPAPPPVVPPPAARPAPDPVNDSNGKVRQPGSVPVGFAILGGIAFVAAVLLIIALSRSDTVLANNLLHLATVLALAITAGVFFFAVLHSRAKYKGEAFGGVLELGGPIVLAFAVGLAAYKLVPPREPPPPEPLPFSITVHARDENQQPVTQGALLLTVGQETKRADLNSTGEGTFKEIGSSYRGSSVPFEERIDDFILKEPQKRYEIRPGVYTVELQRDYNPRIAKVTVQAGTTNLVKLVKRLSDLVGGVMLDPKLEARLKNRKVTFGQEMRDVPLEVALERIFAQAQTTITFEKQGSITWIRQAKPAKP